MSTQKQTWNEIEFQIIIILYLLNYDVNSSSRIEYVNKFYKMFVICDLCLIYSESMHLKS